MNFDAFDASPYQHQSKTQKQKVEMTNTHTEGQPETRILPVEQTPHQMSANTSKRNGMGIAFIRAASLSPLDLKRMEGLGEIVFACIMLLLCQFSTPETKEVCHILF